MENQLFKSKNEVCELMDKLLLQTVDLIEQDVTIKLNIEKLTNEGFLLLAKTRYIQGTNSVCLANLPTDESNEFNALRTVTRSNDDLNTTQFELQKHEISSESQHIDPLKWFGIITPQPLRTARDNFQKATELVIESVNIEQQLKQNYKNFARLKKIKETFDEE